MVKFFLPAADTHKMAEENYAVFVGRSVGHAPRKAKSRLFRITFMDRGDRGVDAQPCVAEVGKELSGWRRRERVGLVLAIIEAGELLYIYTVERGALQGVPLSVGRGEVVERVYFDDFPDAQVVALRNDGG